MSSLSDAEDSNNLDSFFPFFDCSLDMENKELNNKTGLLNFDRHIQNLKFNKFIDREIQVKSFINLVGDFDEETIHDEVLIE